MSISNSEMLNITPKQFFLRWEIFNEHRIRDVKVLALKLRASSMGEVDMTDMVLELNEYLNDGPNAELSKIYVKKALRKKQEASITLKTAEELEAARRLHFPELYNN